MTHEEEKLVLKWLRGRAPPTYAHALLQRALWGDEKLSRPIREALADWIINQQISPGGLFGQVYNEFAPIDEKAWAKLKPKPAPASPADPQADS